MTRIVIAAAKRTPQGRFLGALAQQSAVDLAIVVGGAALQGIDPAAIDQVIVGNVLSAGQGMNIARQVDVTLNVPIDRPVFTVNMMCASGIQAVMLAAQAVTAGEARAVLCGGPTPPTCSIAPAGATSSATARSSTACYATGWWTALIASTWG